MSLIISILYCLPKLYKVTIEGQTQYKYHIKKALDKMDSIKNVQQKFILEILYLFLGIKGRINFLQLGRFGKHSEQYYRNNFEQEFDFLKFNKNLILENASNHLIIAFDPSYINKSGKHTPNVGWYWSGVSGKSKWGLEIGGIAAIDIENHTSFHLEAVPTPCNRTESLLSHYATLIIERKKELLQVSKYVVADAYFSKEPFVSTLCENEFDIISRLRTDSSLQYQYKGPKRKGRGAPKKYDGKVDFANLDMNHCKLIEKTNNEKIYHSKVYSKSMNRWINLVCVLSLRKSKWSHKLYFSTNLSLDPLILLDYYRKRFQIEFTYRDAKQFTALNHCQARSENKLNFHFNASLTAINLAKITYWLKQKKTERKSFSMSSIKTFHSNELLLNRFISMFAILPYLKINKIKINKLLNFGVIAA